MSEPKVISIAKAISWRVVGTLTSWILVFLATGNFTVSTVVSGADFITKAGLYYVHERMWQIKKLRFIILNPIQMLMSEFKNKIINGSFIGLVKRNRNSG